MLFASRDIIECSDRRHDVALLVTNRCGVHAHNAGGTISSQEGDLLTCYYLSALGRARKGPFLGFVGPPVIVEAFVLSILLHLCCRYERVSPEQVYLIVTEDEPTGRSLSDNYSDG